MVILRGLSTQPTKRTEMLQYMVRGSILSCCALYQYQRTTFRNCRVCQHVLRSCRLYTPAGIVHVQTVCFWLYVTRVLQTADKSLSSSRLIDEDD